MLRLGGGMPRFGRGRQFWPIGALVVAGLWLGSCGSSTPDPKIINAQLNATDDVNPDPAGNPAPIFIRLYELTTDTKFKLASFDQLYDKEPALLGQELQGLQEFFLVPGGSEEMTRTLKDGSKFVAVLAAYRDIPNATWRAVKPVEQEEETELVITVSRSAVTIKSEDD